eukprot:jgi/Undpi1/4546/HiC_scaffold_18.g07900.m1
MGPSYNVPGGRHVCTRDTRGGAQPGGGGGGGERPTRCAIFLGEHPYSAAAALPRSPSSPRRRSSSPLTMAMSARKARLQTKPVAVGMPTRKKLPLRRQSTPAIKTPAMRIMPAMAMPLVVVAWVVLIARGPLSARGELRPQSELTSNCFNFPEDDFDRANCIAAINDGNTPYLPMSVGDDAIDFTLHDLDGEAWNLGETLEATEMPVVMIWGMLTCPGFQGLGTEPPWDECSYWEENALVDEYKNRATFVHLYGPEPHPVSPATNFDKGIQWQSFWSVVRQPRSYFERRDMAARISDVIHPAQTILTDYFPGNPYSDLNQPVWCSYVVGARGVTVVSPDGKIFFQRGWFHSSHTALAIDKYWCEHLAAREDEEGEAAQFLQVVPERSDASGADGMRGGGSGGVMDGGGPVPVDTTASRARAQGVSASSALAVGRGGGGAGDHHGRAEVDQKVTVDGDEKMGFYSDLSCAGISAEGGENLDVPPLAGMFAGGGAAAPHVRTGW